MKIILVFPPFFLQSMYNLPPLGLINLGTSLQLDGRSVTILDLVLAIRKGTLRSGPKIYDDCAEIIMSHSPDLVGFSAQCTTYPAVIQISKKIKSIDKQVKVIVGGHNASFVDLETIERFSWIDAVVRGEGEVSLLELVRNLDSGGRGEGVAGVTYRGDKGPVRNRSRAFIEDLDTLPVPDYRLVDPLSAYRDACGLSRSIAVLEVGRGCPHSCVYCSESVFWGRRTRVFSVPRLVSEMKRLSEEAGAECFVLAYDQFTAKRQFVEYLCHELITNGLNRIPWYCISRLDTVDSSLLRLMKEAGCESMCYGIDSGSRRTLAFIRKRIDREILYERVRETTEEGLVPTLSYVIGFPEEDRSDIDDTLTMALRTGIVGNNNPLIQMPTVLPGTDLHKYYLGALVREVDTYFALGIEFWKGRRLPEDEELIDSDPFIFSSFYNLPCKGVPIRELSALADYFPLAVKFFPRTFLLLSLERGISVSKLFAKWVQWVKDLEPGREASLAPRDFYSHFKKFVVSLREDSSSLFNHLGAVMDYEQLCLEAARFSVQKSTNTGWFQDPGKAQPTVAEGTLVGEFDFDLSEIIFDLKKGRFLKNYSPSKSFIVFRHVGDELETAQIDEDVKDLLLLCDGRRTLEAIGELLAARKDVASSEINYFCVKALKALSDAGYVEFQSPRAQ